MKFNSASISLSHRHGLIGVLEHLFPERGPIVFAVPAGTSFRNTAMLHRVHIDGDDGAR
jgi:hypothetical protein